MGAKANPKPAAKAELAKRGTARPKASPAAAHHHLAAPAKTGCACGGGCPKCAAKPKAARPQTKPKPRPLDPAEAEARALAPRLSLIGEPQGAKPQTKPADSTPRPGLRATRAPDPRLTRSRRLTQQERGTAEQAMDMDLSDVRLHTGAAANGMADAAGALAFAHGNHIVLGARAERMTGSNYAQILNHELIHVVQQSAPPLPQPARYLRPETRGPPLRPRIRTSPQVQCWVVTDAIGNFASDVGGAVYDVGADAVDGAVDLAGDVVDVVGDGLRYVVDKAAPGLWDLLTGGAAAKLGEWLCQGIDFLLGKLFSGLAEIDIMTALEETFSGLAKNISKVKGAIGEKLSSMVTTVLSPFLTAMNEWGMPMIETIQGMIDGISGVFSNVWSTFAVPALELLEMAGGAIWSSVTWLVGKLWSGVKAVKNFAGWAWDELSDYFGIDWGGESDVKGTLAGYASRAFEGLKSAFERIKAPLLTAVGIFAMFTPLGPVVAAVIVVPPLYEKIKWLIDNWDKAEVVVEARKTLKEDIIPGIQTAISAFKGAFAGAAAWLGSMLGSIAGGLARVVSAFGSGECAARINKILTHIESQMKRFQAWAEGGFAGLTGAINAGLDAIAAFFAPILKFLTAMIQAILLPFTLPAVVFGAVWLLLPDPLKPAVIKFVLDFLIMVISAIPTFLPGLFPLATVFKRGVLGFLRRLGGKEIEDKRRIAATNKVADIMTGSVSFIAGLTVGILRGLVDGIIDPFKLLFMMFDLVMKGMSVVGRAVTAFATFMSPQAGAAINRVNHAISGPPPPAKAAPQTTAPAETTAGPAVQTQGAVGPRAPPETITSHLSSDVIAAPANTNAAPSLGAANTNAAPTVGAAEDMSLVSDVSDDAIMAQMSPGMVAEAGIATTGPQDFTPAQLETQMGGEMKSKGSSIRGLAGLLGGAWDAIMNGATTLGGKAADWFLKFIEKPNYQLGHSLGWLTGTILLELAINYFTAGGYMVIKQGATWGTRLLAYFVRYLDMGGAILGVMGKGLAKLRGPVLGGMDAVSGFLSRFKVLQAVLSRVRGAADWLFRFGDDIGAAADLARKGPVEGLSGRGATGLGDDAATSLARHGDDAAPPPAALARANEVAPPAPRAPRDIGTPQPTPIAVVDDVAGNRAARDAMQSAGNRPPRQGLDDAADGSRRTIDDAGHPTVRDDALRATEFPQAIIAASRIAQINDVANMPLPVVMGQLLYLKRRYRWIDYFRARPIAGKGVFKIGMIASPETPVDDHYSTAEATETIEEVAPGLLRRRRTGGGPRPARRLEPPARAPEPEGGFSSTDIRRSFDEATGGNGGMSPLTPSPVERIPTFESRKSRYARKVDNLENNRVYGGANEGLFTRYLDNGSGAAAQRYERLGEQVHIRPIVDPTATGPARYGRKVIADNVVVDQATGRIHVLDAKTTPGAPLTSNQEIGYPMIGAHGGRIESRGLSGPLGHHVEIPPSPVYRAEPNVKLSNRDDPIPAGGLDYNMVPIPAARTVVPAGVVTPPTSAATRPTGMAARGANESAQQAGTRVGREVVNGPPIVNPRAAVDDLGDGALRATPDPALPTVRNPVNKIAELGEAMIAARTVTEAGDAIDLPVEMILGQLMLLKRRYRWIDTFHATPRGVAGRFEIDLIASKHRIDLIEVDSIFLYHGSPQDGARRLAQAMENPQIGLQSSRRDHDLGQGLYLFDTPAHAQVYAGPGGKIIELEMPLPHPDDIADIALRGFGRDGAPGAQRAMFLNEGAPGAMTHADMQAFDLTQHSITPQREIAKNFTSRSTGDATSPFSRNLARGQLFHGTVPPNAQLAQGGLGFEYDVIQWRLRHASPEIRRQIIEQVFGKR